ncbi:RimK family protein [Neptunicella marina]|uniref:RimK family protein n=1 Tax=Neptunicella marina TaxID=2125989 RepID=A0A8J6J1D0_9ALTE|nr:RimK family protein [Neptunicella marina]MBC3767793.1 RimK family protein [Neptunicella marina]
MIKTIIVADNTESVNVPDDLTVISFQTYLADYPKLNEPKTRIINLCDTEHYLSRGYYCSLLAEARQHKVLPSVSTINDLREMANDSLSGILLRLPTDQIGDIAEGESISVMAYFGWVEQTEWRKVARQVFEKYPSPVLVLNLSKDQHGLRIEVARGAVGQLDATQFELFNQRLVSFTQDSWRHGSREKRLRWDLAILVDPNETHPPSDKDAIKLFIKAAAKEGIHAETVTATRFSQIAQYDALFIRETTAIDHHTYRLARKAEQEGLVVIDDYTSILRCCNKVFLHDAFSYNKVPSLKTKVVTASSDTELDMLESEFSYPMVLKMPEGAFSKGVFKVESRDELKAKLDELFQHTALVLVQEFLYTDFDWRIGVLNGRPIYACRYHMARKHWQIYNHGSKRFSSGGFETLPTFEVPKVVLDAAMSACSIIGRGLYGVDIKQKGSQVYVIEVNDNPSIDSKVEDKYLGKELYKIIMQEFAQRLEQRGRD